MAGHICEIQITLEAMLQVKVSGGHRLYKLARVLNLLEPEVNWHVGGHSETAARNTGLGVLKGLECEGAELKYSEQVDMLVETLSCPSCVLTTLNLANTNGEHMRGRMLVDVLTPAVIDQLSNTLKSLNLSLNGFTGSVPKEIGRLRVLSKLNLIRNSLTGSIPVEIGSLSKLQILSLGTNKFKGSIPREIGALENLREIGLEGNELSNAIPIEILQCTKLHRIVLDRNNLTGKIPADLGKHVRMTIRQAFIS